MKVVAEYRKVAQETLKHFFDVRVNTTDVLHVNPGQKPKLRGILDLAQGIVDF